MSKDYMIKIVADTNDADFVERTTSADKKTIEFWRKLAKKIKALQPYASTINKTYGDNKPWMHSNNWPAGECQRDDLGEMHYTELYHISEEEDEEYIWPYVPRAEYGIHTIETIEVMPNIEKEKLL